LKKKKGRRDYVGTDLQEGNRIVGATWNKGLYVAERKSGRKSDPMRPRAHATNGGRNRSVKFSEKDCKKRRVCAK